MPRIIPARFSIVAALFLVSIQGMAAPAGPIRHTKTLYAFQQPPGRPNSLILAGDGNFYGASGGGTLGFLFKVTPGGVFSIVHDFKDDGAGNPVSLILGKDGNLYGILSSNGAIFKCTLSGTLTVLYNPGSEARPSSLLQGSDGNLYGIVRFASSSSPGSVFRVSPAGVFATIHTFTGGSDGSYPNELVEGEPGIFYGTCGSSSFTFFKVTSAGVFNIVRDFSGTSDIELAHLVYASDGNIYGSDFHPSQSSQPGTWLFRLTPNGDLTTLYNFGSSVSVSAIIQGSDGNLYCSTAFNGVYHNGAISRVTLGQQVTTLYSFSGKDDGYDPGALSFVAGQGLFGITPAGSAADAGTVFHLNPFNQLTTLVRFGAVGNGYSPQRPLLQASDGSFFGTTNVGGPGGYGTVYHLTSSGELVTLHGFGGDTGAYSSLLVLAGDGRLYGASTGVDGKGSVYRLDTTGSFTVLHQFADGDDGSHPVALVASRDGNVYGVTTSSQNSGKYGAFFQITAAGTFTVVKAFDNPGNEAYPAGLVEAKDGNLYGLLAGFGGGLGTGTLFRITSAGVKTDVYTFPTEYGSQLANLIAGSDGNLYGTRSGYIDPSHGGLLVTYGETWQCSPGGTFKVLHYFGNQDGGLFYPSVLLAASDGNLYGLVGNTSGNLHTIVYRLTTAGTFTPLYESNFLVRSLLEGIGGNFYGTAPLGGPLNGGSVLQYIFGAPHAVNLATRMKIGTGDNVSIGGFIINGNGPKKVLLRGIGPSLTLSGKLDDPRLELHDASGTVIGKNDNWQTTQPGGVVSGNQPAEIKASGLAPSDDREAALIASLSPGNYTAVLSGTQNTSGIGVVEIYDLDLEASANLANISTRGFADTGDNLLIGGFITDGSLFGRSKLIVRALGPSLAQFGISNPLNDPYLTIYDQNGNYVAASDNWQDANEPEVVSYGLAPSDPHESALYLSLPGGNYTAVVTSGDRGTGVALVETYNLP